MRIAVSLRGIEKGGAPSDEGKSQPCNPYRPADRWRWSTKAARTGSADPLGFLFMGAALELVRGIAGANPRLCG